MRKIFILTLSCLLAAACSFATTRKVLFIGNSYTYTNNMPLILQSLAMAMGDTLVYDESDPGGYTLQQHTTNATTISKIFSRQWDLVVIQEQSQMPAFPPDQVMTDVYPYATRLDSMVHANDTCTQTMFMMTWGHANGDPGNCAGYPEICTYDGMQQRLRESYMQMGQDNHAVVAPVGMAFKIMIDSAYSPWLFSADSSHPVVAGSYLEACVLYGSIFHKRTLNCSYLSGLSASDARTLQRVADKVVFDSLTLWQYMGHYPNAAFTAAVTGTDVIFTATPVVPAMHSWAFGDAVVDTPVSPTHHYTANGTYVVTHTVATDCFTERITDTIHIGISAINDLIAHKASIISCGNGRIRYEMAGGTVYELEIVDMTGRLIKRYDRQSLPATDDLVPGIYIYRLYTDDGRDIKAGKFMVN